MSKTYLTGFRMMMAGIVCYCCYQWFNWPEGYWSVVTVSAITQSTLSDTMVKALLRMIGTIIGAIVGILLAIVIINNIYLLSIIFGSFITVTTYTGLQSKPYNYAPIVAGFTAVIIISASYLGQTHEIAWDRTIQVIFGILVYAMVNLMVLWFRLDASAIFDSSFIQKLKHIFSNFHINRHDVILSLVISIPTTLTFLAWLIFQFPHGFWVTVTLLIIMEDTLVKTQGKSYIRFVGQSVAAIYGLMVAWLAMGNIIITGIALALGFFLCGLMIGSNRKNASIGNHAGSAIAIMLLVGLEDGVNDVVMVRFLNVFAGIIIANLIMIFYSFYASKQTAD